MDTIEAEQIKECVREVLEERLIVDVDVHRDHHKFLEECIPLLRDFLAYRAVRMAQIKRRQENWEKLKMTAMGAVIVSAVGGTIGLLAWIGTIASRAFVHWAQTQPPGG